MRRGCYTSLPSALGWPVFSSGLRSEIRSRSHLRAANLGVSSGETLRAFGSVIALPQGGGQDCGFFDPQLGTSAASRGFNFGGDASCQFTASTDRANGGDPRVSALGDNGGTTQTRAPQPGSPLLDSIPTTNCTPAASADQRGVSRPQGAGCDVGAVEVRSAAATAAPGSDTSGIPPLALPATPVLARPTSTG